MAMDVQFLDLHGYQNRTQSAIRMRRHRKAEEDKFPPRQSGRLKISDRLLSAKCTARFVTPQMHSTGNQTRPEVIGPGPRMVNESGQYYEIERIIGASSLCGCHSFLIKWLGWPVEYCTWEPETALCNATRAKKKFFAVYGMPTCKNGLTLSPEGERFEQLKRLCSTGAHRR